MIQEKRGNWQASEYMSYEGIRHFVLSIFYVTSSVVFLLFMGLCLKYGARFVTAKKSEKIVKS